MLAIVAACLAHPFFAAPPPKSTGRETFGEPFAVELMARCAATSTEPADTVATAVEVTARTIGAAARFIPPALAPLDVVRSGGGAKNPALVDALLRCWPGPKHRAFDDLRFRGPGQVDGRDVVAVGESPHLLAFGGRRRGGFGGIHVSVPP